MRRFSPIGVIVGGITDIVATNVAAFPMVVVAMLRSNAMSLPKAEQTKAIFDVMQHSPGLQMTGWVLGGGCSVLGGYVAARLAKRGELLNGAFSSWLCVGAGIYSMIAPTMPVPLWQHLAAFVISPGLGVFGGILRLRQINRQQPTVSTLAA